MARAAPLALPPQLFPFRAVYSSFDLANLVETLPRASNDAPDQNGNKNELAAKSGSDSWPGVISGKEWAGLCALRSRFYRIGPAIMRVWFSADHRCGTERHRSSPAGARRRGFSERFHFNEKFRPLSLVEGQPAHPHTLERRRRFFRKWSSKHTRRRATIFWSSPTITSHRKARNGSARHKQNFRNRPPKISGAISKGCQ